MLSLWYIVLIVLLLDCLQITEVLKTNFWYSFIKLNAQE